MRRESFTELSEESDESSDSSDDDEDFFGRPMSVHDIRKQMRPVSRPNTAASGPKTPEKDTSLPRHTFHI